MHNWNPLLVKDGLCQRFGPDAGIFPCHSSLSFLETWDWNGCLIDQKKVSWQKAGEFRKQDCSTRTSPVSIAVGPEVPGSLQKQTKKQTWPKLCIEKTRESWEVAVFLGLVFIIKGAWFCAFIFWFNHCSPPPSPSCYFFPVLGCKRTWVLCPVTCVHCSQTFNGPSCLCNWTPIHLLMFWTVSGQPASQLPSQCVFWVLIFYSEKSPGLELSCSHQTLSWYQILFSDGVEQEPGITQVYQEIAGKAQGAGKFKT